MMVVSFGLKVRAGDAHVPPRAAPTLCSTSARADESRRALCAPRDRRSATRQSFRVHSADHLISIMLSYAKARRQRNAAPRQAGADAAAALSQTMMLVLAYFASLELLAVVVAEIACACTPAALRRRARR
jgi:hypothetical protein